MVSCKLFFVVRQYYLLKHTIYLLQKRSDFLLWQQTFINALDFRHILCVLLLKQVNILGGVHMFQHEAGNCVPNEVLVIVDVEVMQGAGVFSFGFGSQKIES